MLTFVPTPIGNLQDISYRSIQILQTSNIFFCEDTRVTKKLLNLLSEKFNIDFKLQNKEFISVHSFNEILFLNKINREYIQNNNIAYLSDAGMPCVSDPGAKIVDFCLKHNIDYDVLPGSNALLTAYAMSGFSRKEFLFFGFLPHKGKERENGIEKIILNEYITILYESTHRLLKLLKELNDYIPNREIFLVKEISKKYQNSFKNTAKKIYEQFKNENIKGEWVVVISSNPSIMGEAITLKDIEKLSLPPKEKAKIISKLTGKKIKDIYTSSISASN